MLSEQNKQELIKRAKSLAWKLGAMIVVALLNFLADNLNLFNLPGEAVVVAGLILSEISKIVSNRHLGRIGRKTE